MVPVEAEAQSQHPAHARVEPLERAGELLRAQSLGGRRVRTIGLRVLDQVAVEALAVADRSLEADRVLDEVEELLDALGREAALFRDLGDEWITVQFLGEDAPCAQDLARLLGDVDGKPDRAALVGKGAGHGLANPPGGVRGELEPELVVELLDGSDQTEVSLLDQVEERDAGFRVVPGDRHHEPQVRLDQLGLGSLVAFVLAPGELTLFDRSEQSAVADLAHVELEWILGRPGDVLLLGRVLFLLGLLGLFDLLVRVVESTRNDRELGLEVFGVGRLLREWPRHSSGLSAHPPPFGNPQMRDASRPGSGRTNVRML